MYGLGQLYGITIVEQNAPTPGPVFSASIVEELRMSPKEEGTHQSESPALQRCCTFSKDQCPSRLSTDPNSLGGVS